MAKSVFKQMQAGAKATDWASLIPSVTSFIRELFVQVSGAITIMSLMGIDIILGGISAYFMFQDVPLVPAGWLAAMFSIALSGISYRLWLMVRKGSKYDTWVMILLAIITPLDLWVDMAFMEIVYGTGNVWLFMSKEAFAAVHRPPLWWGFLVLIGVITLVNEPLTAVLTEAMKKKKDFNSRYQTKSKPTAPKVQQKYVPKHRPNTGTHVPVRASNYSGRPGETVVEDLNKILGG